MKNSTAKICAVFLTIVASGADAQFFSLGSCPTLTPFTPAFPALIVRTWYEYARTPSMNEHGLKCVSGSVTFNNQYNIRYTARSKIGDIRLNLNGNAVYVAGNNVGSFAITFDNNYRLPFIRSKTQVYTIISIDGSVIINNPNQIMVPPTYMTLYSCKNIGFTKLESVHILTALRNPATTTVTAARNTLSIRNLPVNSLSRVDQSNC